MSNKNKKHAPRYNKLALTHDKGGHATRVLHKAKKELGFNSERPASRAYCNGIYYPLSHLGEL